MDMSPAATPQVVKDVHAKFWWVYLVLLMALCLGREIAGDIFGAFSSAVAAAITWCMVKDNCARMTQLCVFGFTAMCAAQAFIEGVALVSLSNGRSTEQTT